MPLLRPAWCRLLICKLPIRPRLRWLDPLAAWPDLAIECALGVALVVAVDGRRSSGPRILADGGN